MRGSSLAAIAAASGLAGSSYGYERKEGPRGCGPVQCGLEERLDWLLRLLQGGSEPFRAYGGSTAVCPKIW